MGTVYDAGKGVLRHAISDQMFVWFWALFSGQLNGILN